MGAFTFVTLKKPVTRVSPRHSSTSRHLHKMTIFLVFMLLTATQAGPTTLGVTPSEELKSLNSSDALVAAALVAEASLAVSGSCSLQVFCTAATKHPPKQGSMEKGVADTYKIIAEVVNSVPQGEMVLSRMNQLKTSFELGFKTEDEQICTDIYVCNNPEEGKQGRNGLKCHQTNAACPGVAIGCTLCGLVLPGVCAPPVLRQDSSVSSAEDSA